MHFELKSISVQSIPEALAKVERYRLLNEPTLAESICLDILAIVSDHQQALISLLLARTDQFPSQLPAKAAQEILNRIKGDYEQAYYAGYDYQKSDVGAPQRRSARTLPPRMPPRTTPPSHGAGVAEHRCRACQGTGSPHSGGVACPRTVAGAARWHIRRRGGPRDGACERPARGARLGGRTGHLSGPFGQVGTP